MRGAKGPHRRLYGHSAPVFPWFLLAWKKNGKTTGFRAVVAKEGSGDDENTREGGPPTGPSTR